MNRITVALCSLALTNLLPAADPANLPNLLLIAIDDLKPIGTLYSEEPGNFLQHVYPDPVLRKAVAARMTPNIQRLANRGVTFMNAYCAAPACNPSRAALMTGVRPHVSGLADNANAVFFRNWEFNGERPLADAVTLPELLKANGWYTASTGKIYHSGQDFEDSDGHRSWTDWTLVKGDAGRNQRSPWSPRSLAWGQEGDDGASHRSTNDFRKADFIARVLEDGRASNEGTVFQLPEDRPFFLACGIFRPHLPFYATKDLLDLFPAEEMTITRELLNEFMQDCDDLPPTSLKWTGVKIENGDPVLDTERFVDILNLGKEHGGPDGDLAGWKDMLTHYFASCAVADRAVGRLLDGLGHSPYGDNTVVILWSDHGYHLGETVRETKFTLWDDGALSNFIIADPARPKTAGTRCDQPVSLTDIYPTVAALAGLEIPDPRNIGTDLNVLLDQPGTVLVRPALTTFRDVDYNMVRTHRFKLIRYGKTEPELEVYDMDNDPEEIRNLAGKPEWADEEAELLTILELTLQ